MSGLEVELQSLPDLLVMAQSVSPPLVLPITLIKWGCPYTENRRINVSKSCRVPLLTTLANLTLIILFSEMLKFSKIISSKSKIYIVKQNSGYLGIFHLLKINVSKLINYLMDMC